MPPLTQQQTEKLLKGSLPISQLSFSMLVTLLKKRYIKDPSQTTLRDCTNELNKFISKCESIIRADLANIATL